MLVGYIACYTAENIAKRQKIPIAVMICSALL